MALGRLYVCICILNLYPECYIDMSPIGFRKGWSGLKVLSELPKEVSNSNADDELGVQLPDWTKAACETRQASPPQGL